MIIFYASKKKTKISTRNYFCTRFYRKKINEEIVKISKNLLNLIIKNKILTLIMYIQIIKNTNKGVVSASKTFKMAIKFNFKVRISYLFQEEWLIILKSCKNYFKFKMVDLGNSKQIFFYSPSFFIVNFSSPGG
jgi:hypothetical protein